MLPPPLLEKNKTHRGFDRATLLRITFAMAAAFFISQINLDYAEAFLYDLQVRFRIFKPTPSHVELIYIRPSTIQKYKGLPPASVQNDVLLKVLELSPKAVVFDLDLNSIVGSIEEKNTLESTITSNAHVYVATTEMPMKGQESQLFLKEPLEKIQSVSSPKTMDSIHFAKDKVSRRLLLTYQNEPVLPVRLAALFNAQVLDPKKVRGHFEFYDTDQAYIDFLSPESFSPITFEDLANVNKNRIRDKIVWIGTDLDLQESDYAATPYNHKPTAITRSELQANVIESLIRNSGPIRAPPYFSWFLTAIVSLLTVHIVLTSKPTQGLIGLATSLLAIMLTSYFAFNAFGVWVSIAHPLLSVLLCYYFFIPYRLIVENRRSWEYYQKNKLLSQVEELKSNFISMMSHDLKTPIARIQGMSDVILTDSNHLSSQQREAVDTIKHSSDDLLKFINAILNYGRIESQGVQLHLQSKDVNSLLKEVIRKHEFLAKLKRIRIVSELEPLFPISVDPELMKQVLSNLVENAIKYSPEDTKILVSSEERDSKVVIQVADQGPGIPPDELNNIFMKFFRSKNAKSSPIKGSGLGLYLAKYFTELHKGDIFVESSIGNGSTFTVELPIEQGGLNA